MTRTFELMALALAAFLALGALPAAADCYYNGQSVPEGTVAGGLVCRGGQWVPE